MLPTCKLATCTVLGFKACPQNAPATWLRTSYPRTGFFVSCSFLKASLQKANMEPEKGSFVDYCPPRAALLGFHGSCPESILLCCFSTFCRPGFSGHSIPCSSRFAPSMDTGAASCTTSPSSLCGRVLLLVACVSQLLVQFFGISSYYPPNLQGIFSYYSPRDLQLLSSQAISRYYLLKGPPATTLQGISSC